MKNYLTLCIACLIFVCSACNNSQQKEASAEDTLTEANESTSPSADSIEIANSLTNLLADLKNEDYDAFIKYYDETVTQISPDGETVVKKRFHYKNEIKALVQFEKFKVIAYDVISISFSGNEATMKADYKFSITVADSTILEDTNLEILWVNKDGWKINKESLTMK